MSTIDTKEFVGDFLEHFGIKGMKWGFRKADGNSAVDKAKGGSKDTDSDDFTRTADIAVRAKSQGIRSLSNRELRDLVDRINLEQNFNRVNTPEAKKTNPIKAGVQYVAKKVTKAGDMTVDTIMKTAIQIKVQDELKRKMTAAPKASPQLKLFDYG